MVFAHNKHAIIKGKSKGEKHDYIDSTWEKSGRNRVRRKNSPKGEEAWRAPRVSGALLSARCV